MTQQIVDPDFYFELDLAKTELERIVQLQLPGPSELVLAQFPRLAADPAIVLELVYLEYVLLQEFGHDVEVESFIARFPTLRTELRRMLEVDRAFNRSPLEASPDTLYSAMHDTPSARAPTGGFPHDGIGDYELLEVIGRGGMGLVYKARQKRLNRLVALKTIDVFSSFNEKVVARFKTEAELAAGLQHANIVPIYEIGTHEGVPFFSMELVVGGSLQAAMGSRPLRPKVAARLVETLARAVAYAHDHGVIHRDLKPANILLAPSNRGDVIDLYPGDNGAMNAYSRIEPKIADFGLAKQLASEVQRTQTGAVLGTPSYMAPEQIESCGEPVGPAADVYSLGAILYDSLVGRPPFFAATPLETLHQVRFDDPVAPRKLQSKIPRDLETICLTCLHKEPHRRYPTAEALAEDLRRFTDGAPIRARATSSLEHLDRWVRRNPALAALAATVLIATIGLVALWRQAERTRSVAEAHNEVSKRVVYAQDVRLAQADLNAGDSAAAQARLERTNPALRKWEWDYLQEQCGNDICQFKFDLFVRTVCLSPDGQRVAIGTCGPFGTDVQSDLAIGDVETGRILHRLRSHPASVECVRFSPDGSLLASCGVAYDAKIAGGFCIWDASTGELLHKYEVDAYALAFAPDGKSIAVGTRNGKIQRYSLQASEPDVVFTGHRGAIHSLAFRPDGKYLASAGRDGTVRIWSMNANSTHPDVIGIEKSIDMREIDWSSNGKDLVARHWGQSIRYLRQMKENLVVQQRIQWSPACKCVRFSPDGMFVLVCALNAPPTIYDSTTGAVHGVIKCDGRVFSAAFDRSGRRVVLGCENGTVRIWDLANCVSKFQFGVKEGEISALAQHPTKSEVIAARTKDSAHSEKQSGQPRVDVFDLKSPGRPRKILIHDDWLTSIDYSPDGNRIASGSLDRTVAICDSVSGRLLHSFAGHDAAVTGVAFLNEGKSIASASEDSHVRLFEIDQGTVKAQWNARSPVRLLRASPNGKILVAYTDDQRLYLLNSQTLAVLKSLSYEANSINTLAFGRGTGMLAIGRSDGKVELWTDSDLVDQVKTATSLLLTGHNDAITGMAFWPDGDRIATISRDSCIKLWDLGSISRHGVNSEIVRLPEMLSIPVDCSGILRYVSVSPDGRQLTCWDQFRTVFNVDLQATKESPIDNVLWHKRQLALAREARHRQAEFFHLFELCRLQPEQITHLRELGFARIGLGQWPEAEQDLLSVLQYVDRGGSGLLFETIAREIHELSNVQSMEQASSAFVSAVTRQQDNVLLLELARCQLQLGKVAEYRSLCKLVEKDLGNSLNSWAWISAISPSADQDWKTAIGGLKKIKNIGADPSTAAYCNTLAMVYFRNGQLKESIRWANKGAKLNRNGNAPFDWLVLALAYARLGDRAQAQDWLDKVHSWLALQEQQLDLGQNTTSSFERHYEPDLQLLVAEAEALLDMAKTQSFQD